jgi:multiple sugar transport system substrate-binding protein
MTESVELRGMTWDHVRGRDPLVASAKRFEADTGVRVTWEARPLQAFAAWPIAQLSETYDLIVLDHPHIGEVAPSGVLVPLDMLLDGVFLGDQARNSVGPSYRSYEWVGHLWALAIDAAGHVSAYRPDLLEQLGAPVPQTWDDVFELANLCRQHGRWISLPLAAGDTLLALLTLCANSGSAPYADPEHVAPRGLTRDHLETLRRLAEVGHPHAFEWNPIQLLEAMADSDELVYCPILFGYSNYSRPGFRRNLVRFQPIPSAGLGPSGGVIGGAGLSISASSRRLEEARDYAAYVASPEVQRTLYFERGGQPGHRSAWTDPAVNEASHRFFADTLPGLDAGYLRPRYDGALSVQNDGGEIVQSFLRQGGRPDAMLDTLDAVYRRSRAIASDESHGR